MKTRPLFFILHPSSFKRGFIMIRRQLLRFAAALAVVGLMALIGQIAPDARAGVLDFVNTMNANSTMVIFFIDKEGDLGASAWTPARYDRLTFGRLVERWNTDIREALQRDPERARALIR